MQIAHKTLLPTFQTGGRRLWLGIFLFVVFVLASQIAPLMSPSYIWDDLVWQWTFSKDGTGRLFGLLTEVGHPAFWPFLDAAYRYFGAHATLPTSLISTAFHLLNAIILMRLLSLAGASRTQAFFVFLLYLLSPYYFNRGTVSHYFYDIFMCFFLGSVYLGVPNDRKTPTRTVIAVCAQILSFGLPTLVMLEPLRLFVYWMQCKGDHAKLLRSISLFWFVAVVCSVCSFFLFKPSGYYEGYNELKVDPGHIWVGLHSLIAYVPSLLRYHATNIKSVLLTPHDWPIIVGFLTLSIYVAWCSLKNFNDTSVRPYSLFLLAFGFFLMVSGGVPYILAGRAPIPWDFNSRLFYVSGIGLVITLAAAMVLIPSVRLRALVIGVMVCFFMVSNLGQAKAYLYDHSIRQAMLHGFEKNHWITTQSADKKNKDVFVVLTSEPELADIFFQYRSITPVEFSVPLNISRPISDGRRFIYYYGSRNFIPPDLFLPTRTSNCSLAAHDRYPCPNRYVVAKYTLGEDEQINNVDFVDLFSRAFLSTAPVRVGSFQISVPPQAFNREEMFMRWYQRSAELGVSGSQNIVGEMYMVGFHNLPRSDKKAAEWFRKAVAGGSRDARVNLGIMYLEGRGVDRDINQGVELIRSSAGDGYARAQYRLGSLYEQGVGVAQDETQALEWYRKAAQGGNTAAQLQLGLMFAYGRGVPQQIGEAVRWLRQGARQNDKAAQYHLAMLCAKYPEAGCRVEEIPEWLNKSALQGFIPAQWQLAYIYEHGIDVSRALYVAYFWYRVIDYGEANAAERLQANKKLTEIGRDLPNSERSHLEQRARAWRPISRQSPDMQH